jgi:porin
MKRSRGLPAPATSAEGALGVATAYRGICWLRRRALLARVCLAFAPVVPAAAQADSTAPAPDAAAQTLAPDASGPFGFLSAGAADPNLFGDMGEYGLTLNLTENAEIIGNVTGGAKQGFEENGLTTATLQLDTQKAFGWNGGTFNVSGLHIWGGDISSSNLDTLQLASNIEAEPSLRLWELWYQQKFGDKVDIKIGEQSIDQELMLSTNAGYFLNAVMGWPALPTENMPAGGPVYPLAGLGVRLHAQLGDNVNLLAGVFNGSPAPLNSTNPQISNPSGVSFPLNTGALAIAELQFSYAAPDPSAKPKPGDPLPGTYKIGVWYDSEAFNDLQFDNAGVPLASPAGNGTPLTHRGNYAVYGVVDQMVWRDAADAGHNINLFVRPMFTTLQDRNLISFSVDAGLTLLDPFPGRAKDAFALGIGIEQISNGASGFDSQMNFYQPCVYTPVRSVETFLEATYQYQATAWLQIQPDVQYVFNPGAGVANPSDPTQKIKNELVIGLRTNITF